ncbi:hypothetical protein OHU34_16325 [Streptomyces sp. NBC_00080]|uniref:hypothetical protein n=1 Tax=Streptomyces TaxID=1883 RepID=UPI00115455D5|nr:MULTISPECIES: hypothetical protein [Streptomyces]MCX5368417.1 hypothetical protein [Streptomyces sp. NBC_00103]TQJ55253.1 hypothetical protein FBY34_3051 [Streptomyces sp. SLBN-115]
MAQKVDVTGWSAADYLKALDRGTSGMWSVEAAVWLLDRHGVWLDDPRFRAYVDVTLNERAEPWAGIDVPGAGSAIDAGEFGEWNEDVAVLCFVLSLYGTYPIPLRYTCENISEENLALIGKALYLACGYDEPS